MEKTAKKQAAKVFMVASLLVSLMSCRDESFNPAPTPGHNTSIIRYLGPAGATECTVTYLTGTDLNWYDTKTIILLGDIRVGAGKTLTISKGTIIKGEKASRASLTIERGAKINAAGTYDRPIVFTSDQPPGFIPISKHIAASFHLSAQNT